MPHRYRYRPPLGAQPSVRWLPGFCCAVPAGCCLLWIGLLALCSILGALMVVHRVI